MKFRPPVLLILVLIALVRRSLVAAAQTVLAATIHAEATPPAFPTWNLEWFLDDSKEELEIQ